MPPSFRGWSRITCTSRMSPAHATGWRSAARRGRLIPPGIERLYQLEKKRKAGALLIRRQTAVYFLRMVVDHPLQIHLLVVLGQRQRALWCAVLPQFFERNL